MIFYPREEIISLFQNMYDLDKNKNVIPTLNNIIFLDKLLDFLFFYYSNVHIIIV